MLFCISSFIVIFVSFFSYQILFILSTIGPRMFIFRTISLHDFYHIEIMYYNNWWYLETKLVWWYMIHHGNVNVWRNFWNLLHSIMQFLENILSRVLYPSQAFYVFLVHCTSYLLFTFQYLWRILLTLKTISNDEVNWKTHK